MQQRKNNSTLKESKAHNQTPEFDRVFNASPHPLREHQFPENNPVDLVSQPALSYPISYRHSNTLSSTHTDNPAPFLDPERLLFASDYAIP